MDGEALQQVEGVVADHDLLQRAVRQLQRLHVVEGGVAVDASDLQRLQSGQVYGSARRAARTAQLERAAVLEVATSHAKGLEATTVCASEPRGTPTFDDEGLALLQTQLADGHRTQGAEV